MKLGRPGQYLVCFFFYLKKRVPAVTLEGLFTLGIFSCFVVMRYKSTFGISRKIIVAIMLNV